MANIGGVVAIFMIWLAFSGEQYSMAEKIGVSVIFTVIPLAGIPMIISSHKIE